jgi:hypothetical protein
VQADHAQAEDFVHVQQMAQIGAREMFAGKTFAAFFDRAEVGFVGAALQAVLTFAGEGRAVARHARRQHAIEHVHTACDQFHHLRRRAEAHGVTRLVRGQMRLGEFHRFHHLGLGLAHTHAADGVTVKFHRHQRLRALLAQLGVAAALTDAEHELAFRTRLLATFLRPADGALDSVALVARGRVVRRAFVEHHCDVRAERALNFHRFLRPEKQLRAIQMRAELDAVRLDLANLGKAEHLKSAAVREDGFLPVDEIVQSARRADDVHAGADVEMIRVAENDLRAHLVKFARVERLDAALRAHGHEDRRVHHAMLGGQSAQARLGGRVGFKKFKHRMIILGSNGSNQPISRLTCRSDKCAGCATGRARPKLQ